MTEADVDAAREVQNASFADYDRRFDEEPVQLTPESVERQRRRLDHFLAHVPDGCWVAEQDGTLVGVALASQRDGLWGLSLLVVSPGAQSRGVGRRLLDAALAYARTGAPAVILSSRDPRAMHGYATAGFDLHPQVEARGEVVTRWLQKPDRDLREGRLDRSFADRLDAAVRGSRRGADHELLGTFYDAFAIDDASGAG